MQIERSTRCLTTSEVLWALVSPPEIAAWLVGLDDALPGQSAPVRYRLLEPEDVVPPQRLTQRIRLTGGSLVEAVVAIELTERGEEGVDLYVRFEGKPRTSWTGFLTLPRVQRYIEGRLERHLDDLHLALAGRQEHYPVPDPLADEVAERLGEALAEAPPRGRDAVFSRLQRAPLAVQSVLRPAEIAAQDDLPLDEVIRALIAGVERGLLDIEWALICPQSRSGSVDGQRCYDHGMHCAACGIRYATGLYDSAELVFRPRPTVRPDGVSLDRLIRGRAPQNVARHRIDLRQSLAFTHRLEPGRYLLETGSGSCLVDVATSHPRRRSVCFALGRERPARSFHVQPGEQHFEVTNPLTYVETVQVSRRWRSPFALTATTLYELPSTRNLLPSALLAPACEVFFGAVVVVDCGGAAERQQVQAILRATTSPELLDRRGNRVVGAFRDLGAVLVATEQMVARQLMVGVGIGIGLVNLLRTRVRGPAWELAEEALRQAGPPQVAVHGASVSDLEPAIAAHGRAVSLRERPGLSALVVFAAVVDGVPELPLEDAPTPVESEGVDGAPLERIAGCTIVGTLGRGALGTIYEVERPSGERLAAKVLHPHLDPRRFAQLFFKEGYYMSQLRHPRIVTCVDWGEDGGRPYLLMELLRGRTLYARIKEEGPLPAVEVVRILCDVLRALGAVHARGWVHRDIKPHNVFLLREPEGAVKLLDFGLTRPAGRALRERFAGTPEFMAPEQVELGEVDARSDLYGVGALGFYMLTATPPFAGKTRGEGALLRMDGVLPEGLDPEELGPLAEVLERALQFDKEDRWTSAESMLEALEALGASGLG